MPHALKADLLWTVLLGSRTRLRRQVLFWTWQSATRQNQRDNNQRMSYNVHILWLGQLPPGRGDKGRRPSLPGRWQRLERHRHHRQGGAGN